ncbi:hypothetical protein P0L94_10435 [Microbacter sp. GSS18]|nr:hypothetical protein P0L94_10435 [Microbacter sp. GSS18]
MTTATASTTVKDVLLPEDEPPPKLREQAAKAAEHGGVADQIARLTAIGLDIVGARIGHVVGDLLGADLGGIIGSALTKNQKIVAAITKTQNDPKAEEVVTLADQKLESSYKPSVDVIVDEKKVTSIPFEVSLETKIEGGLIVVKGGEIVAVRTGRGTITGTLKCEGVEVAKKKVDYDLAGILRMPSADTSATRGAAGPVVTGAAASAARAAGAAAPLPSGQPSAPAPAQAPRPQASQPHAPAQPAGAAPAQPAGAAPAPSPSIPPPPTPPPVGFIQDGWRFTASGQWERVTHYLPGDIVNGHRLNAAGNAWEPLPPG